MNIINFFLCVPILPILQVMELAGFEEDIDLILSYLQHKIAPFVGDLFVGVHDSNSIHGSKEVT